MIKSDESFEMSTSKRRIERRRAVRLKLRDVSRRFVKSRFVKVVGTSAGLTRVLDLSKCFREDHHHAGMKNPLGDEARIEIGRFQKRDIPIARLCRDDKSIRYRTSSVNFLREAVARKDAYFSFLLLLFFFFFFFFFFRTMSCISSSVPVRL